MVKNTRENKRGDVMKYGITIQGEPMAKGRPRLGKGKTYTPQKTKYYENMVKLIYMHKHGCTVDNMDGKLKLTVRAFFGIPKSKSKKLKKQMELNEERPIKRPDIDNVIKIIADSLNGIAYADDSQIVEVVAGKYYSNQARVEMEIEKI